MAVNYGKKFELKMKADFLKSFPKGTIDRIYDTTMGYKKISNVSDFIAYNYPFSYYLECKSTLSGTFNIGKLTQKDKLKAKMGIKGINAGVIIWFITKEKVCYVPIEEIDRLEKSGYKSVNSKMIGDKGFNVFEIPSELRVTFMDSNYSILDEIAKEKLKTFDK